MEKLKPVLIVENCTVGLTKKLDERLTGERKDYILSGTFTEFNIKNRNDRVYTAPKFVPHVNELLERKKLLGVIYGEFDHPDVFDTSLKRVSHTIESITYNQERNIVEGSIRLLNTQWGKEAKALVDDNCPIFVSSRAAGITESNGEVTVKKLFTYDAVADPGFSSARMSLNESLGFTNESVNFRIYEVTDESKINQLFTMNNNDNVTKNQMEEYSNYLSGEIVKIKNDLETAIKEGKLEPKKIEELSEYYSNLNESFSKVTNYLDYLAENIQILVNDNNSLKTKTENIIKHNDYLAENLEKSIAYSEYLAEKLDKNIDYSEYIAETLSKNIDFSEYIAEHVDKNIKYSEYLAESIDKTIEYSEYLAEKLDDNISYSEYLAEHVDSNISYSEYLAENLDNAIKYGEYLAEHLDNSIAYSEYIAENLEDTQAYSKYIAESLDNSINYQKYVATKLKSNKLYEDLETPEDQLGDLTVTTVASYYDDDDDDTDDNDAVIKVDDEVQGQAQPVQGQAQTQPVQDADDVQGQPQAQTQPVQVQAQPQAQPAQTQVQPKLDEIVPGMNVTLNDGTTGEVMATNPQNGIVVVKVGEDGEFKEVQESNITKINGDKTFEKQGTLLKSIETLILESKKRKASNEKEPHFMMFLSESNKNNWLNLSDEDKEKTIVALNESKYTSEADVLNTIQSALNAGKKSFNEIVVDKMPDDLKPVWESLDSKIQAGILAQVKLYNLNTDYKIVSFWNSRGLTEINNSNGKKLIKESHNYMETSELSDEEVEKFKSAFRNLR
jgi:preprotein translocase subunit YajC